MLNSIISFLLSIFIGQEPSVSKDIFHFLEKTTNELEVNSQNIYVNFHDKVISKHPNLVGYFKEMEFDNNFRADFIKELIIFSFVFQKAEKRKELRDFFSYAKNEIELSLRKMKEFGFLEDFTEEDIQLMVLGDSRGVRINIENKSKIFLSLDRFLERGQCLEEAKIPFRNTVFHELMHAAHYSYHGQKNFSSLTNHSYLLRSLWTEGLAVYGSGLMAKDTKQKRFPTPQLLRLSESGGYMNFIGQLQDDIDLAKKYCWSYFHNTEETKQTHIERDKCDDISMKWLAQSQNRRLGGLAYMLGDKIVATLSEHHTLSELMSWKDERIITEVTNTLELLKHSKRDEIITHDEAKALGYHRSHDSEVNLANKKDLRKEAFLKAILDNNSKLLVELIFDGANVDEDYEKLGTPLLLASRKGFSVVVDFLLSFGSDPNKKGVYNETPLKAAVNLGETSIVRLLLRNGANPNIISKGGWSAITEATKQGHHEIVEILLDYGANPNIPIKESHSSRLLDTDMTALQISSEMGLSEVVKILLSHENKSNLDHKSSMGYTALMFAVLSGHIDVAQLLLDSGADPYVANNDGISAVALGIFYTKEGSEEQRRNMQELFKCFVKGIGQCEIKDDTSPQVVQ